jgi:excisionase family DNA binding protein
MMRLTILRGLLLCGIHGSLGADLTRAMTLQPTTKSVLRITEAESKDMLGISENTMIEETQKPCRTTRPRRNLEAASTTPLPRLLYSKKDVAYQLSVSLRSIDYLIAERRINTRKIGGRVLIPHEELMRFVRSGRCQPMQLSS